MNHRLLIALSSAIVIMGIAGCGTSSTGSPTASMPAPAPTAAPQSACAELGGTSGPDQTCHVHNESPSYTMDFRFPVNYPDMLPVTDFLSQRRDRFVEWVEEKPVTGGAHYELNIVGHAYQSSGTRSLVLNIGTDGGVHPVMTFKAFNYDVSKRVPITFETLFKPGAQPLEVLNPIVQRELVKRDAADVSTDSFGVDAYQNFVITDDSVTFFIDQDGLLPHVVGALKVTVPRSELAPLLADSDAIPPCESGQVTVTGGPPESAVSHRAVTLTFGLAPGASACTVTGYPGVDTGARGPLLHAQRTARGYMGGLPAGVDEPPTVTLSPSVSAHAVVEGVAVDEGGNQCTTYTVLRVTPPNTTETSTVPTTIDSCELQIHPVTA